MKPDDGQLPKVPRPKQEIEVSTIYWYKRALPRAVPVTDTGLVIPHLTWGFTALYGQRGQQVGLPAAREWSDQHGSEYTVIDVRLRMENPILQGRRDPDNMVGQEILPLHQLQGKYAQELDDRLRAEMHLGQTSEQWQTANSLMDTVMRHPSAAQRLLSFPEFEGVKVLVHMAKTNFSDTPLPVATLRDNALELIVAAQCRLDPDLEVTLPNVSRAKDRVTDEAPAPEPVPAPNGRPRPR
jgi:hypothetical protein